MHRLEPDGSDRYSLSSYQHPSEIPLPNDVAGLDRTRVLPPDSNITNETEEAPSRVVQNRTDRIMRRKGYLSGVKEWYESLNPATEQDQPTVDTSEKSPSSPHEERSTRPNYVGRGYSMYSFNSLGSDMVEPAGDRNRRNGTPTNAQAEDLDDLEKNTLRQLDYKTRRKHMMRIKIEYNVTCRYSRLERVPDAG